MFNVYFAKNIISRIIKKGGKKKRKQNQKPRTKKPNQYNTV